MFVSFFGWWEIGVVDGSPFIATTAGEKGTLQAWLIIYSIVSLRSNVFLFVVLSLVVGLCFFGQVVMVEYLPSFICLEGIGFVNHLSLLWFRAIMIPAAPYTDFRFY